MGLFGNYSKAEVNPKNVPRASNTGEPGANPLYELIKNKPEKAAQREGECGRGEARLN